MALNIWFEIPGPEQQQSCTLVLICTGFKCIGGVTCLRTRWAIFSALQLKCHIRNAAHI